MHFDNLIFILLIAAAALFRLLVSKAGNAGKSEPPGRSTSAPPKSEPIVGPPADTDEERIRRFLEALGQPTSSKPPPPVAPRTDIPPRPLAPVQPPPSMRPFSIPQRPVTTEERRKRYVVLEKGDANARKQGSPKSHYPDPITSAIKQRVFVPKVEETPAFEVRETERVVEQSATTPMETTEPEMVVTDRKIDIGAFLGSPSALRNAIILREIFGPPRSLQPLDLTAS